MSTTAGTEAMGRVTVAAKIENLQDRLNFNKGEISADQIRSVTIDNAVIDTGCVGLALPRRLVSQLGLQQLRTRRMRTANGERTARILESVLLYVQGRDCGVEVFEVADDCPVLIGQIPLEALDFVVDLSGRKLIGNPEHGGEWIAEFY